MNENMHDLIKLACSKLFQMFVKNNGLVWEWKACRTEFQFPWSFVDEKGTFSGGSLRVGRRKLIVTDVWREVSCRLWIFDSI